jgi:hypothetical protein
MAGIPAISQAVPWRSGGGDPAARRAGLRSLPTGLLTFSAIHDVVAGGR